MTRRRAGRRGTKPLPVLPHTDDDVTLGTGEHLYREHYFTPLAWEIAVDLKRDQTLGKRWMLRSWGPTAVMLEERSTHRELWVRSATKWKKLRRHLAAAAPRDGPGDV